MRLCADAPPPLETPPNPSRSSTWPIDSMSTTRCLATWYSPGKRDGSRWIAGAHVRSSLCHLITPARKHPLFQLSPLQTLPPNLHCPPADSLCPFIFIHCARAARVEPFADSFPTSPLHTSPYLGFCYMYDIHDLASQLSLGLPQSGARPARPQRPCGNRRRRKPRC